MTTVSVTFPIVIYPSEEADVGRCTAHCLNMDIVADDDTIEGAVSKLLESIEAALHAANKYSASALRDAPKEYWDRFAKARPIPKELSERIIFNANQRHNAQEEPIINFERECEVRQLGDLQSA